MRPPIPIPTTETISAVVLEACQRVVVNPKPIVIPVQIEAYSLPEDCHVNVIKKMRQDGGSAQYGWVIWEIPDWSVRLEFHSVWKDIQGKMIDVTVPIHDGPCVLFLPDPERKYEGLNIATIHHPYNDSALCRDYVDVSDRMNRLMLPPGKRPIHSHEILTEELDVLRAKLRAIYVRAKAGQP